MATEEANTPALLVGTAWQVKYFAYRLESLDWSVNGNSPAIRRRKEMEQASTHRSYLGWLKMGNRLTMRAEGEQANFLLLAPIQENKSGPGLESSVDSLLNFLHLHSGTGLFIVTGSDFDGHLLRHYQSIANQ